MTNIEQQDMTPQEVAAQLRMSINTVYKHLRSGRMESYRLGGPRGEYRVTEEQLERFKWRRDC